MKWVSYLIAVPKVTDSSSATAETTIYSKAMGAYAGIAIDPATIDFGSMALGGTAAIQTPADHIVTVQVTANDAHDVGVKSEATWAKDADTVTLDPSGTPDAAGEFALTIDDAGDGSGHPATPQAVTTSSVTITDHGADARTATAPGVNEGISDTNLYMDLKLYTEGIVAGLYSGTITFKVTN